MKDLDHIRHSITEELPYPYLLFHFGDEPRFHDGFIAHIEGQPEISLNLIPKISFLNKNAYPRASWDLRAGGVALDRGLSLTERLQLYKEKNNLPLPKFFLDHSFEPLYIDMDEDLWTLEWPREHAYAPTHKAVIHSEISDDVQKLIDRGYPSVYWFAHGYLCANYWYSRYNLKMVRDLIDQPVQYPWVCLNRLVDHQRSYRIDFLNLLDTQNGFYTLPQRSPDTGRSIQDIRPSANVKPFTLDLALNSSAFITVDELTPINNSFLHVVPETMYTEKKIHLTEKTFRPIVLQQPFVLLSCPGALQYLKSYGFKTFDEFWDESYDEIQDDTERMKAVAEIVNYIGSLSLDECDKLRQKMRPILEHNRNWFYNGFADSVWNELRQNIKTASLSF